MERLINFAKRIYGRIPLSLLNIGAPVFWSLPPEKRMGTTFLKTWQMLEQAEKCSQDELDALVDANFCRMIEYCYNNVPYYREYMDRQELKPEDFHTVQDVQKLPFLTKDILSGNREALVARGIDQADVVIKHTSGSTGKPTELMFDKGTALREWANVLHLWKRVGYCWDSSRVVMRCAPFRAQQKGKQFQWDGMRRELSLNIHDMSEENCALYCRQIERYKPDFIHGYPSAVFQLCTYIRKHPLRHHFRAVLLVSETITDAMRQFIEEVLQTQVYGFYGHTERAVLAGQCEKHIHYHVEPTYGYVEIIDENGMPVEDERPGEIVVTGFTNFVMPLIRYRTGDIGQWDLSGTCDSSCYHRILKTVSGRSADFLYNTDGTVQNVTGIRDQEFYAHNVLQHQFRQEIKGIVELYMVVSEKFDRHDMEYIQELLRQDSTDKISFRIKLIDHICPEKNGKVRLVIQKCMDS